MTENAFHIKKGTNPNVDSYSAFWDNDKVSETQLSSLLREQQVTDVYVCGLAYDVCVGKKLVNFCCFYLTIVDKTSVAFQAG